MLVCVTSAKLPLLLLPFAALILRSHAILPYVVMWCGVVCRGVVLRWKQALLNNHVVGISTGGVAEVFEQNAREGKSNRHCPIVFSSFLSEVNHIVLSRIWHLEWCVFTFVFYCFALYRSWGYRFAGSQGTCEACYSYRCLSCSLLLIWKYQVV